MRSGEAPVDQNGRVDAREQSRVQRGENDVHIDEDRPPVFRERDKLLVEARNSCSSQLAGICPLVAHDDLVTGRIVPGEPWITIKPMSNLKGNAERSFSTLTKLRLVSIPSNVDRDEGRVCIAFLATRPGYDVSQAIVAAYQVYGLNAAISAGVSGVMTPS